MEQDFIKQNKKDDKFKLSEKEQETYKIIKDAQKQAIISKKSLNNNNKLIFSNPDNKGFIDIFIISIIIVLLTFIVIVRM